MWDNITVGKFQQLWDILNGNFHYDIEKKIHLLSCLEDRPVEYYEALPIKQLTGHLYKIQFLSVTDIPKSLPPKSIQIGKHSFKPLYEFNDVCAGQFIDIMSIAKNASEQILNLHKILSAICLPVTNKRVQPYGSIPFSEVANIMLEAPIIQAHSIAVFFYQVWTGYLKIIPAYLDRKIKKGKRLTETELLIYGLASVTGGDG